MTLDFLFFFIIDLASNKVIFHNEMNSSEKGSMLSSITDFVSSLINFFLNLGVGELKSIDLDVFRIVLVQRGSFIFGLLTPLTTPLLDAEFKLKTISSLILSEENRYFPKNETIITVSDEVNHLVEQVLLGEVLEISKENREVIQQLVHKWKSQMKNIVHSVSVLSFSGSVLVNESWNENDILGGQEMLNLIHSESIIDFEYFVLATEQRNLILHSLTSGLTLFIETKFLKSHTEEKYTLEEIKKLVKVLKKCLTSEQG